MISRPLSPLRNTTRKRPRPGGSSLLACQCTRKPPVSLVNVSVCLSPPPDQLPIGFQATDAVAGGAGGGADRQALRLNRARTHACAACLHARRIANSSFQIPPDRRMI